MLSLKLKYSTSELITKILIIMLWINCFFAFFPVHRGSVIWTIISDEDAYKNSWIKIITYFNFFCTILILIIQKQIPKSKVLIIIGLLSGSLILSKVYNLFRGDSISVFAIPIEYLAFYLIIRKYTIPKKNLKYLIPILSLWIILPLLFFFLGSLQTQLSFIGIDKHGKLATFSGFALHRNFLGCYIGLIFLLVLFSNANKYIKGTTFIASFISIFLSASRSSILCLLVALVIYAWHTTKKWRIPLLLLLASVGIGYYALASQVEIRKGNITDNSDREELIKGFQDSISVHPILGAGKVTMYNSPTYTEGAQAHNFILQTWCDYGIISLILFTSFWFYFIIKGNVVVRAFISYIMCFGLFQPYFMLTIPNSFIWLTILFIALSGGKINQYK